jgi:hypothetical protein
LQILNLLLHAQGYNPALDNIPRERITATAEIATAVPDASAAPETRCIDIVSSLFSGALQIFRQFELGVQFMLGDQIGDFHATIELKVILEFEVFCCRFGLIRDGVDRGGQEGGEREEKRCFHFRLKACAELVRERDLKLAFIFHEDGEISHRRVHKMRLWTLRSQLREKCSLREKRTSCPTHLLASLKVVINPSRNLYRLICYGEYFSPQQLSVGLLISLPQLGAAMNSI